MIGRGEARSLGQGEELRTVLPLPDRPERKILKVILNLIEEQYLVEVENFIQFEVLTLLLSSLYDTFT